MVEDGRNGRKWQEIIKKKEEKRKKQKKGVADKSQKVTGSLGEKESCRIEVYPILLFILFQ